MVFFEKALRAKIMSTHLLIRANVRKHTLYEAYELARAFEARYSAYIEESYLNEINRSAGAYPVSCTSEDHALFSRALQACNQTQGRFDISIGALSHATYRFGFKNQHIADRRAVTDAKSLVDYTMITLTEESIYLKKYGMRLDLGGIGKGYLAKEIATFLKAKGATKILVDVGGEIVTLGKRYTIAIKDPMKEGYIGYIRTDKSPSSISTSGNYERKIDHTHYHILDTKSGYSPLHYSSLTLMQNGWDIDLLDAYATALFTTPPSALQTFCQEHGLDMIVCADKPDNPPLHFQRFFHADRIMLEH